MQDVEINEVYIYNTEIWSYVASGISGYRPIFLEPHLLKHPSGINPKQWFYHKCVCTLYLRNTLANLAHFFIVMCRFGEVLARAMSH